MERRRQLLQAAVSRRPGDLGLLMTLGGRPTRSTGRRGRTSGCAGIRRPSPPPRPTRGPQQPGHCAVDKGQMDEAIACYRKAIELDPKFASPQQPGQCAEAQGPGGRGHRLLPEGHRARPEVRHGPHQPGHCAAGQGPGGRGHRLLQQGHRTRPEVRHGPQQPGHCADGQGPVWTRPSPASARPSSSTRSSPAPTTTWACPGEQGPVGRGHRLLSEGHRLDPKLAMAHINLGNAPEGQGPGWTRPSPATARPSSSTRSMPRPTTTWAMR